MDTKTISKILIISGIILLIYALIFMDVTVEVDYPEGNNFNLPSRVNNLGLMADRQNYLIASSVFIIIGLVLFYLPKSITESESVHKQCPQCAEKIKREAKICRFCSYDFLKNESLVISEYNITNDSINENLDKNVLVNLHNLIKSEQKRFFGGYSKKVSDELESICITKEDTVNLLNNYKRKYDSELLDEIKKLANHIDLVKKNLKLFISFEIIEKEYPFKKK